MAFTRVLGPGIHTASNINSHNINSTGIITAVSFVGNGAGLTGIASTDNIITGTAATFNTYPVDINAGMDVVGVSSFQDIDVDGHTNLDNVSIAGVTTISGAAPNLLFTETDANPDWGILCSAGQMKFQDVTNTSNVLTLDSNKIQAVKNLDAMNGIDVTGNANVTGNIDVDGHTNLDNVNVAGVTTFASNAYFGDNDKIIFGSGNRFQIYDNGTSAIIDNSYGGGSILRLGSGNQVVLGSPLSNNQNLIRGVVNGPAELYHAGAKKLETYASGINVTGNTVADGLTIDGDSDLNGDLDVDGHTNLDNVSIAGVTTSTGGITLGGGNINLLDRPDGNSHNLFFGTGAKSGIYHDGTNFNIINNTGHSYIGVGAGSKDLYLYAQASGNVLLQQNTGVRYVKGVGSDASVQLFFNNNLRLNTTNAGVSIPKDLDVDGHTNLDNVSIAGVTTTTETIRIQGNNKYLTVGASNQIGVVHTGGEGFITNSSGHFTHRSDVHKWENFAGSSEYLRIDNTGILLVGHSSSPTSDADKLQVISTSSGTGLCLHNYSASNYGNQIAFMKSRNGTIGSNTILNNGDRIGELNFYGNDGSGRSLGAQISVRVNGTPSNDNTPAIMYFMTGTNQSMSTRLSISSAGNIGISKNGWATSDNSFGLTVHTGSTSDSGNPVNDGIMIVSQNSNGNQNSTTGKLMFCGHAQTNGPFLYGDNEQAYGKKGLVFHTRSTANSYSTQLEETARFTHNGRFGLGTGTAVDSLMHIQGNSDSGDEACQLTIEDEDDTAGSRIPSIQFKGNGTNQHRIRGTDTSGLTFASWNGSSHIERATIGNTPEGGAFLLNADDRGWATFRHNNNQGLRTHIRRHYSPGNAVQTQTILRIRRHWWGWGTYKITCKALYYNSSLESVYYVNGHLSGGNHISIAKQTFGGDASNQDWSCTVTHTASNNSPGTNSTWYADIKVNIPNYYYVTIVIEAFSSQYSVDPNNLGTDSYCLM